VLVCGSGVGAAVAANKLPGIRAGLCHDTYSASGPACATTPTRPTRVWSTTT
jgi:ribose 5-phosphate isomerase RpiB